MNSNKLNQTEHLNAEQGYTRPTDDQILKDTVSEKIRLASDTPGLEVEFDPEEAELAGAFEEDALSAEDAEAARWDG